MGVKGFQTGTPMSIAWTQQPSTAVTTLPAIYASVGGRGGRNGNGH